MASKPNLRKLGAQRHADGKLRCAWCPADPLYVAYHDTEWGVPLHDDGALFEMLCLEGAQAGLSWLTGAARRRRLMHDPGIVRNRLKVEAFISNAKAYLEIRASLGSFDDYIWQFTGGEVLRRRPLYLSGVAQSTAHSDAMSKDLKRRGFRFVGSTICHAFMQAVGIVDEHQRHCWAAGKAP
jgi:DNA-3-methyladenine glycosylase I